MKSTFKIARWAIVAVKPEDNKIIVFKSGILNGSMICVPKGFQETPIAAEGFNLKWKNAQKKEKKSIASEIKNNQKPIFNPFWTGSVW